MSQVVRTVPRSCGAQAANQRVVRPALIENPGEPIEDLL